MLWYQNNGIISDELCIEYDILWVMVKISFKYIYSYWRLWLVQLLQELNTKRTFRLESFCVYNVFGFKRIPITRDWQEREKEERMQLRHLGYYRFFLKLSRVNGMHTNHRDNNKFDDDRFTVREIMKWILFCQRDMVQRWQNV
jgi:hypothetical protein